MRHTPAGSIEHSSQQTEFSCSANVLQKVLAENGLAVTEMQLTEFFDVHPSNGMPNSRLAVATAALGCNVHSGSNATLHQLQRSLQNDMSVVVNYRAHQDKEGHFGQLQGVNTSNGMLELYDPWYGTSEFMDIDEFDARWKGGEGERRWAMAVSRSGVLHLPSWLA